MECLPEKKFRLRRAGGSEGSVTIEAAVCMWVLTVFIALSGILFQILALDLKLQRIVSGTAAELAARSRVLAIADSIRKEGCALGGFEGVFFNISDIAGDIMAGKILRNNMELQRLPEYGRLSIDYLHLPFCGDIHDIPEECSLPGIDINDNDAAIIITYLIKINLPLLGTKEIRLRHMAIERGWVKGDVDMFPLLVTQQSREGVREEDRDRIVFVTNTGTRYHASDCFYLHTSRIEMKLGEAVDAGYVQCLICRGGLL